MLHSNNQFHQILTTLKKFLTFQRLSRNPVNNGCGTWKRSLDEGRSCSPYKSAHTHCTSVYVRVPVDRYNKMVAAASRDVSKNKWRGKIFAADIGTDQIPSGNCLWYYDALAPFLCFPFLFSVSLSPSSVMAHKFPHPWRRSYCPPESP